jgi:uncharacterized cofD-like protein
MERYGGDFLAAVDGLRSLLGCTGRVWPVSTDKASVCAEYGDGSSTSGEVEVDAGQSRGHYIRRVWLDPSPTLHPAVGTAIRGFDAAIIGPGSFYTSLMPPLLVDGVARALADVPGPIVLIANLLTEGRGMSGFTAGEAVRRVSDAIERPVDVVIVNSALPSDAVLAKYQAEHKAPLAIGDVPAACEVVEGEFWQQDIARHHRRRLSFAVWAVLARRLLQG